MDDLPARLRRHAEDWHGDVNDALREAADEIERLRAVIERLREANDRSTEREARRFFRSR